MKTAILVIIATVTTFVMIDQANAQYYPPNPSMPVMCTSRQIGSSIITNCF